MKKDRAVKTFRQMKADNMVLKMGMGLALCASAILAINIATRDEAVILVPPFQHETIEFINGRANKTYYEQWAWSVAMLAGNITPGNASFVRGELQRIATPTLYRKLTATLDVELQNIVRDNAVITFSPREVVYDPELNRFFVSGNQGVGGPGLRKNIEKQMTYELGFTTERLRIYLNYFDVYEGRPMTQAIRELELKRKEEKEKALAEEDALQ